MQKNPDFRQDPAFQEAQRLAHSDTGQRLLAILQQTKQAELDQVIASSQSGDMEQVRKAMSKLLSSPDVQALLKQMGGESHG